MSAQIESRSDFENLQDYWKAELDASHEMLKKWHKQSDKIISRYIDSRKSDDRLTIGTIEAKRLNLFNSNVRTMYELLYGQVPQVEVARAYLDSADDVARVAANMLERTLNNDIADDTERYDDVLCNVLLDRLLSGLGVARVRYAAKIDTVTRIDRTETEHLRWEDAPLDYVYWGDVRWSWTRTWSDMRWLAFKSYLTKDQVKARFPKVDADGLEYLARGIESEEKASSKEEKSAWLQAEVWEIWDKPRRQVVWFNEHVDDLLDTKEDPLQLVNFFPCPKFFIANPTTTLYLPTPDYHLAQDLYNDIDLLQTRIGILTKAVKAVGVYDKNADGVQRMFKEGTENDLIPVDNWALLGEQGGLQGVVDWLPLADIVAALDKLRELRDEQIQLLYQVTGFSDIMRGQLDNQYEGVGQSKQKVKFASARMQAMQKEFARFASDLIALKAEVICRHFEAQTIAGMSAMQFSPDQELLPQALELLKNPDVSRLRIRIQPESMSMVDYAELQAERTAYVQTLSVMLEKTFQAAQALPGSVPVLLQFLQWTLAAFRGGDEMEGVLDRAIEQANQAAQAQQQQPKQPSPEEIKAQAAMQLEDAKHQHAMEQIQANFAGEMQKRLTDKQADFETFMAESRHDIGILQAELQAELTKIQAKLQADTEERITDARLNAEETLTTAEAEVRKDTLETRNEIVKEAAKAKLDAGATRNEIIKEAAKAKLNADVQARSKDAEAD